MKIHLGQYLSENANIFHQFCTLLVAVRLECEKIGWGIFTINQVNWLMNMFHPFNSHFDEFAIPSIVTQSLGQETEIPRLNLSSILTGSENTCQH